MASTYVQVKKKKKKNQPSNNKYMYLRVYIYVPSRNRSSRLSTIDHLLDCTYLSMYIEKKKKWS